jgi:hypothetical protein
VGDDQPGRAAVLGFELGLVVSTERAMAGGDRRRDRRRRSAGVHVVRLDDGEVSPYLTTVLDIGDQLELPTVA